MSVQGYRVCGKMMFDCHLRDTWYVEKEHLAVIDNLTEMERRRVQMNHFNYPISVFFLSRKQC